MILILNLLELEKKVGYALKSYADIKQAADKILSSSMYPIVVSFPSLKSLDFSQTYYADSSASFWLSSQSRQTFSNNVKAIFLSAIETYLELNYCMQDAVVIAQMCVNHSIRLLKKTDVDVDAELFDSIKFPENQIDLPFLADYPIDKQPVQCHGLCNKKIGIYPIIDSVWWLKKLLPLNIHTFQLRIKNKQGRELEDEIQEGVKIAKENNKKLFINDYWQLAIRHGAYGVHLGQEDLNTADIAKINQAGLRLGISSHCYYEVARAHAFRPSYIACGPIFSTTTKIMPFSPQGVAQLKRWRRTLTYHLVAIGGISWEKLPEILATNVEGIAMISAITKASDPILSAKKLLKVMDEYVNTR